MTDTVTTTLRTIIGPTNGSDVLFQIVGGYDEGSLWTFVVNSTNTATEIVSNTYYAGGYFQLTTAPASGSNIYCIYTLTTAAPDSPSNFDIEGVTITNILDIANILKTIQANMKCMETAIDNRVSILSFTQYTDTLNSRLTAIDAKLQLSS